MFSRPRCFGTIVVKGFSVQNAGEFSGMMIDRVEDLEWRLIKTG
jgi:hypothetical protein